MGQTANKTKQIDPNDLNGDHLLLWFDDLGTGNEEFSFLSNFHIGDPITLPGVSWGALIEACRVPSDMREDTATAYGVSPDALIEFLSGEHAFAAMKFWGTDFDHFYAIVQAHDVEESEFNPTTGKTETYFLDACNHAKSLGRSRAHPLRPDWEVVKLDVMAAITRAKYDVGRPEASRLLATGDRLLVEGTYWGDDVWGVCLDRTGMPGRNWLGSLLMMRRAELRAIAALGGAVSTNTVHMEHFVSETGAHNTKFVR